MLTLLFLPLIVVAAVISSAKAGWKSTLACGGVAALALGTIGAMLLGAPHGAISPLDVGVLLGGIPGCIGGRGTSTPLGLVQPAIAEMIAVRTSAHFPTACGKV